MDKNSAKKIMVLGIVFSVIGTAILAAVILNEDPSDNAPVSINEYVSTSHSLYNLPTKVSQAEIMTPTEIKNAGYADFVSDGYEMIYREHKNTDITDLLTIGTMDNIWYPGAVLKIGYDDRGSSTIDAVNLPRAPMTLSMSLETAKGVDPNYLSTTVNSPSLSSVRTSVGQMLSGAITSETNIPTALSCQIIEINSSESINLGVGVNTNFGIFDFGIGLDYSKVDYKTRVALVFQQVYFTIDMDRPDTGPKGAFLDSVTGNDLKTEMGNNSTLAYCSVVYGKIAVIEIETNKSVSDIKAAFSASYSLVGDLQIPLEFLSEDSGTTMNYFVYGGSEEQSGIITSSNISEAAKAIVDSKTISPKPIGYRFYYLQTGNVAKIAECNEYVSRDIVPIKLESFDLTAKNNNGTQIEETTGRLIARAGDRITPDFHISPDNAIIYKAEYSLNDYQNAELNTDTGMITIKDTATPNVVITYTVKLIQDIGGTRNIKQDFIQITIKETKMEKITIQPLTEPGDDKVNPGSMIGFEALVVPHNASYPVRWSVYSNISTLTVDDFGICRLNVMPTAQDGDEIILIAEDPAGGATATYTLTVVWRSKLTLTDAYNGSIQYIDNKVNEMIYDSVYGITVEGFSIGVQDRTSDLKIILNNITIKASSGKAAIYSASGVNCKITIVLNNSKLYGSNDGLGYSAQPAIDLANMILTSITSGEIHGGDGSSGSNGIAGNNGAPGLRALTLVVNDETGKLKIYGGDGGKGGNASSSGGAGASGGDGGIAIVSSATLKLQGNVTIIGGKGGDGGTGGNGIRDGNNGTRGGDGGKGGNGGAPISSTNATKNGMIEELYGNGGNGGRGGNGGEANQGALFGCDGGDGGNGGNGGNGHIPGSGGNGGNGGPGREIWVLGSKIAGNNGKNGSQGQSGASLRS